MIQAEGIFTVMINFLFSFFTRDFFKETVKEFVGMNLIFPEYVSLCIPLTLLKVAISPPIFLNEVIGTMSGKYAEGGLSLPVA